MHLINRSFPDLTGPAGVYDIDAVSIVNPACP
jgi:hypothetical protein